MGRTLAVALALVLVGCTAGHRKAERSPRPSASASATIRPSQSVATGPKASGIGFPRGIAPVYVGLGSRGVVVLDPRTRFRTWYGLKMLVAVDPLYNDRFVITAHEDSGPRVAKFQFRLESGLKSVTRLVFPADGQRSPRGWRYAVVTLLV